VGYKFACSSQNTGNTVSFNIEAGWPLFWKTWKAWKSQGIEKRSGKSQGK